MTMRCAFLRQIINQTHNAYSPEMLWSFLFSLVGEIASHSTTLHWKRDITEVTQCASVFLLVSVFKVQH